MANQPDPKQAPQVANVNDFFKKSGNQYREIKALGWDYFHIPDKNITMAKLYEASHAQDSDEFKFGIIPVTYTVEIGLIERLKHVKEWPCILQAEVITVPGAKNKSTSHVLSVAGIGV